MLKKMVLLLVLLSAMLPAQEKPLIIRMVRHGQPGVGGTDFTPEQKKAWIRLGLTPLGRSQAETTGKYLKKEGVQWSQVIASPQERASETADIICGIIGKTFTLEPNLREIGNPIPEPLDGLRRRFKNLAPDAVLDLTPQQRKGFKETGKQQGERGKKYIMSLFQKKAKGPILLVTHGNFMYTTIQEMTGKYANPWNCGMSELKVWPDGRAELVKGSLQDIPDKWTIARGHDAVSVLRIGLRSVFGEYNARNITSGELGGALRLAFSRQYFEGTKFFKDSDEWAKNNGLALWTS